MKEKMYYPDEEYEDVYGILDDEVFDDRDQEEWYIDEFPDDVGDVEPSTDAKSRYEWNDEDFMDYPPSRGRKAS